MTLTTIPSHEVLKGSILVQPQPGPQQAFLDCKANIAVYGGAAGAGKTWALLVEALRNVDHPAFGAVFFRKSFPQIMNEGGLWDSASEIYPQFGGVPFVTGPKFRFPSGAEISFAHIGSDAERYNWDGAQIPLICFDQLEHFSWKQFTYMLSRNRASSYPGPCYIRATCNPNPDHFLREFMRWWIDDETGYAIPERSGVLRWFIMLGNEVFWADTPDELKQKHGAAVLPKSFTFIPGDIEDNQILLHRNPDYLANLEAMPYVERMRLRHGNWNIRETAGTIFRREWFTIVPAAPVGMTMIRYWDRAGTEAVGGKAVKGASWTAGALIGKTAQGVWYLKDMVREQKSPFGVEEMIKAIASQDGRDVMVGIEQDPGQAGKAEARLQARNLAGYNVRLNAVKENKATRARMVSAQAEAGNFFVVAGPWNEAYLQEAVNFDGTPASASDQVDAVSGAFYVLTTAKRVGAWGR